MKYWTGSYIEGGACGNETQACMSHWLLVWRFLFFMLERVVCVVYACAVLRFGCVYVSFFHRWFFVWCASQSRAGLQHPTRARYLARFFLALSPQGRCSWGPGRCHLLPPFGTDGRRSRSRHRKLAVCIFGACFVFLSK